MLDKIMELINSFLNRPSGPAADRLSDEYGVVTKQLRFFAKGRAFRLALLLALTGGLLCLIYGCGPGMFGRAKLVLAGFGLLNTILLAAAELVARKKCRHARDVAVELESKLDPDKTRLMLYRDSPDLGWLNTAFLVKAAYGLVVLLWIYVFANVWCGASCGYYGPVSVKRGHWSFRIPLEGGALPPGHPPMLPMPEESTEK